MLRFEIEILLAGKPAIFQVEDLDPWPNEDGYVRYAVSGNEHNSVILIDTSYWEHPFILTEEDAFNYLERMLYPQPDRVYSEETVFSPAEQELIRQAIGKFIINNYKYGS